MGASLAVLAAGFLAPLAAEKPDLKENRKLAAAPAAPHDWTSLRAWPKAADTWIADHFPARPYLIAGLNRLRLVLGVSGSPRVIVGRDGWLFYDNTTHLAAARNDPVYADADAKVWLEALAGRSEALAARGAVYVVLGAPEKEAIYGRYAPAWHRTDPNRAAAMLARLAASSQAGEYIYPGDAIAQQARYGLKTYSRHDTHWTGLGAYYAYVALMNRLHALGKAEAPRPLDSFRELETSNRPRNMAQMLGVSSFVDIDYPMLVDPPAEARIKTVWLTPVQDWTKPHVIETGQTGKPVLMLTMDSFSNALVPFLYSHFSRIVVSHGQDGPWREDLMAQFNPDIVVLEVIESGVPLLMRPAPPASEDARRRIAEALARPHRILPRPTARKAPPPPPAVEAAQTRGTEGADTLTGTGASDVIIGRPGDDRLGGAGGRDTLFGGRGDDVLDGGGGADWLSGDRGDDTLSGGRGGDVFHSFADAGIDRIVDFSAAEGDRVALDAGVAYTVRQVGPDTVVEMSGGRVVLVGVVLADLPLSWIRVG